MRRKEEGEECLSTRAVVGTTILVDNKSEIKLCSRVIYLALGVTFLGHSIVVVWDER